MPTLQEWLKCDGLPVETCRKYQAWHARREARNAESPAKVQKSRGLGDTVAKFTRATGIDRVVKAVTGGGCGCKKRQEKLNQLVPYK